MAGDLKLKYGSASQTITISLSSLADSGIVISDEISNTSDLFNDVHVQFSIKTNSTGVSGTGAIYAYAIANVGSAYPDATNYTRLPIGVINANSSTVTYTSVPMSVARAFGGILPEHYKIAVENKTGVPFDPTEGNHIKVYQGIYGQYT